MKPLKHSIPSHMVARPWQVVVVGAGGTGSAMLTSLARLHHAMLELGHPGGILCTVFDDDTVSPTNIGRQSFYPSDIGAYKAAVLVNRINLLMGTDWKAQCTRLTASASIQPDLIIGCVDTRAARKEILKACRFARGYYLDCGNESDRGQVILGQLGEKRAGKLPHVGELFPDLVDPSKDKADLAPSCSMADALRKQSLVINQAIAVQAFNLLWTLYRTGTLQFCGSFINLATGRTNPLPLDREAWARFGYQDQKARRKPKSESSTAT
ncbi:thiamine biosynthesis protein ThiF (plasmid) [Cupriavidus sp. USMAA2-4]|uniref:PRTRC system ThiF family protein n=1 Tax=Cupriavidus sp. USMAA2-4 TaxID=876364 RepID=UPI0008A700A2|nr:PRTRC system ThiF family protein [Cupriavidus sp. USMAA2-4]AOY97584.1 thiamine biosynthesis protein ThiF [Cupriavidus sp. USMAA2-4]